MFAIARTDSDGRLVNGVAAIVLAVVLIGTLYVGREVFVPIALAILLSFVSPRCCASWSDGTSRCRFPLSVSSYSLSQASFSSAA